MKELQKCDAKEFGVKECTKDEIDPSFGCIYDHSSESDFKI